MNGSFFAGSYGGDDSKIGASTRLECPVCWYLYDPAAGDELSQIPPGTPFAELPADWCCPNCGGPRRAFLIVTDG